MKQVYVDQGLPAMITRLLTGGFRYHLYENDITPDRDTEQADFDEPTWTGYAYVDVPAVDFTLAPVVGHVGSASADAIEFTNTSGAPVDVYGFYACDTTDSVCIIAGRFDGAPITVPDGESITLVPTIGDQSKNASS